MMKRLIKLTIFLLFIGTNVFSQQFEMIRAFPFGSPFDYFTSWDKVEGSRSGFGGLTFWESYSIAADASTGDWIIFDNIEATQVSERIHGKNESFSVVRGKNLLFGSTYPGGTIRIINSGAPIQEPSYIIKIPFNTPKEEVLKPDTIPYMTGNILFAETLKRELISWELLANGSVNYRGISDTNKWLDAGNAEKIGYKYDQNNEQHNFGEFTMSNEALYMNRIWKSLLFPDGKFKTLGTLRAFKYLGGDSKGLSYFYAINPPSLTWKELYSTKPFQIIIAILDTWTKKVTFRELPIGDWNPPRTENDGVLVACAKAIHPNGDVYFVDVDEKEKEYQLKRLKNDWWTELGVDKRKIGRIVGNYIALRTESTISANNNGFNFENEFVWIIEESKWGETINGTLVPWVKVRKIDGREGWVLLSDLYFD